MKALRFLTIVTIVCTGCEARTAEEASGPEGERELHAVTSVRDDGPTIGTRSHPLYPALEARASSAPAPDLLGFGRLASESEIALLDIDVGPDGAGLPPGAGTAAKGGEIYLAKCAQCHGINGEGGLNDRLVQDVPGERGGRSIGSYWPYATTLFDYVRRAMPYTTPGSLSNEEVYHLTAWLLFKNGVVPEDAVIDATTLHQIVMPARDLFVSDDREQYSVVR